jgi:hypothetical protein
MSFQELPENVQAKIGLYLTRQERENLRFMGPQESFVFSDESKYVYRIKSTITVKFDQSARKISYELNFPIYTDPVGNARVEDYRAIYPRPRFEGNPNPYSSPPVFNPVLHTYSIDSIEELFRKQIPIFRYERAQWNQVWISHFTGQYEYNIKYDYKFGLWDPQELVSQLQRMAADKPFSLVKVKHYSLNNNQMRLNLSELADDSKRQLNDFFNVTMAHEIICTKVPLQTSRGMASSGRAMEEEGGSRSVRSLKRMRDE